MAIRDLKDRDSGSRTLRTLNDLIIKHPIGRELGYPAEHKARIEAEADFTYAIRKEGIKWVKAGRIVQSKEAFMNFMNITEEDL